MSKKRPADTLTNPSVVYKADKAARLNAPLAVRYIGCKYETGRKGLAVKIKPYAREYMSVLVELSGRWSPLLTC